ncbi:MAG: ABC transporter permease [Bacilli bacterium]
MSIYKLYIKIFKKNFIAIVINLVIALGIGFILANNDEYSEKIGLDISDIGVVIDNQTQNDYQALEDFLKEQVIIVPKSFNSYEEMVKQLTFNNSFNENKQVDYVLVITNDGLKSYASAKERYKGILVDQKISAFLNLTNLYQVNKVDPILLNETLKEEVKINLSNPISGKNKVLNDNYNYLVFGLFGSIFSAIATITIVIFNKKVFNRTQVSPYRTKDMMFELFLGHFSIVAIILISANTFIYFIFGIGQASFWLYALNTVIFALPLVSLVLLITNVIHNASLLMSLGTVLSILLSFISGAFVPISFLPEVVVKIASFTPTYWFINFNHLIATNEVTFNTFMSNLGIQLLFSITFITTALVLKRAKITIK